MLSRPSRVTDQSDFERGFIVGACMAGDSVLKTANDSMRTVSGVTSAFRAMGKTSVKRGRKLWLTAALNDCAACALV